MRRNKRRESSGDPNFYPLPIQLAKRADFFVAAAQGIRTRSQRSTMRTRRPSIENGTLSDFSLAVERAPRDPVPLYPEPESEASTDTTPSTESRTSIHADRPSAQHRTQVGAARTRELQQPRDVDFISEASVSSRLVYTFD